MAKKISISLSQSSIQNAIDELNKYKNSLKRKQEIFIERLAKEGLQVIRSTMESIPDEESGRYNTEIVLNNNGDICGASIRLSGEKILFLEFSAGVKFGTQYYPLPSGKNYGAGTYPSDKNNWANPWGWWYIDERGEKHHSYGNRAYMPMYRSSQAIVIAIREIAKEVFGR